MDRAARAGMLEPLTGGLHGEEGRARMKKTVNYRDAVYTIAWSPVFSFDKYNVTRVVPETSGLVYFTRRRDDGGRNPLFIYGCWRDGMRMGIKYLFDPDFSKLPKIAYALMDGDLFMKFAVVDTTPLDMKDILAALIAKYAPEFNAGGFSASGRYESILVKEMVRAPGDVVDRIPIVGS